jgi:hypothetical protein
MDNDHIKLTCTCGKRLRAPRQYDGKRLRCPGCGQYLLVEELPVDAILVEKTGALSTPIAKLWIGVASVFVLALVFVAWHAWSTKRERVKLASVRVAEATKAAEQWIQKGTMDQFDAAEKKLVESLSDPLATNLQEGTLALERVRIHREDLMRPSPAPPVVEAQIKAVQVSDFKELVPYLHAGTFVRSYLVAAGTKAESLVDLAHKLHSEYPESRLQFFDDASQFDEYRECDELYLHLPKKPRDFPTEWFGAHLVGKVHKSLGGTWEFVDLDATSAVTMKEPERRKSKEEPAVDEREAEEAVSSGRVRTGGIVRVRTDTFLASDEETLSRVTRLSLADDKEGIVELMLSGRLAMLKEGTKVRVIDPGIFTSEIRALSGSVKGRSGFVVSEAIK